MQPCGATGRSRVSALFENWIAEIDVVSLFDRFSFSGAAPENGSLTIWGEYGVTGFGVLRDPFRTAVTCVDVLDSAFILGHLSILHLWESIACLTGLYRGWEMILTIVDGKVLNGCVVVGWMGSRRASE